MNILVELLGICQSLNESKYRRTGKPNGRPPENKIYPRPKKDLWFRDKGAWHNDLYIKHHGVFRVMSSDDDSGDIIACDDSLKKIFGRWYNTRDIGVTFLIPRPIHTSVKSTEKLIDYIGNPE